MIGGEVALNIGSYHWPNYVLLERNISCVLKKKQKEEEEGPA